MSRLVSWRLLGARDKRRRIVAGYVILLELAVMQQVRWQGGRVEIAHLMRVSRRRELDWWRKLLFRNRGQLRESWILVVKLLRAHRGCLGVRRR